MIITLQHHLILCVILFVMGIVGVVARSNTFVGFMSAIVMIMSGVVMFVAFGRWSLLPEGQVIAVSVVVIIISIVIFACGLFVAGRKS